MAEEGLTRFPHSAPLRNNLAVLYERRGELERAEQLLAAALEEEPSLPQLSKNLGDLLYRSGRADEARQAYQRAVKLAPRLGDDVYFKLGNLAIRERDSQRAEAYWREALAMNPVARAGPRQPRDAGTDLKAPLGRPGLAVADGQGRAGTRPAPCRATSSPA